MTKKETGSGCVLGGVATPDLDIRVPLTRFEGQLNGTELPKTLALGVVDPP
jgi:hypothetical protein